MVRNVQNENTSLFTQKEIQIQNDLRSYLSTTRLDKDEQKEAELVKYVKDKLSTLNAESFLKLFNEGSTDYVNRPKQVGEVSYSPSAFFRTFKSYLRTPKNVTDTNVMDKLKEFLSGSGNKDEFSLKYRVVEALLFTSESNRIFYQASSPQESSKIIDLVLKQLGPSPGQELDDRIHKL